MNFIDKIISESIRKVISEARFDNSATPINTRSDRAAQLGYNPIYADNGGHANNDVVAQVATVDRNGANFSAKGNNIILSDNKFTIYKIKNFGTDKIDSTLGIFGRGAAAEKELRRMIDTLNGAARRNGKYLQYRTISPESKVKEAQRSGYMISSFWEFSFNGTDWYIMKPNGVQNMQQSKLVQKIGESKKGKKKINEAADSSFDLKELSSIPTFKGRLNYCKEHLGPSIGRGSSRLVFQVDDEKCLKLAMNEKGIAQNEAECDWYKNSMSIFPHIIDFDSHSNLMHSWLLVECVLPAKEQDFQYCLGLSFKEFCQFVRTCAGRVGRNRCYMPMEDSRYSQLIDEHEELQEFENYIGNYDPPVGDMVRLANYGLAKRNGDAAIVLLDHGLTDDIYNTYYKRK